MSSSEERYQAKAPYITGAGIARIISARTGKVTIGLTSLSWEQKIPEIQLIAASMDVGERLTVIEYASSNEATKYWLHSLYGKKRKLQGMDDFQEVQAKPYIPRPDEWLAFFNRAGMWASIDYDFIKRESTWQWIRDGEITKDQLPELNSLFQEAPPPIRNELHIVRREGVTRFDQRMVIIGAYKKPWG